MIETQVPQCNGWCCERITLRRSVYRRLVRNPAKEPGGTEIVRMLRYQGLVDHGGSDDILVFACSNFDTDTRRCAIYDRRPGMCRTYPDDKVCRGCGGVGVPT